MTREEAAEQIYGLILSADDEDGPCIFSDQIEALEMGIEALKQPEIIRCTDCKYAVKQGNVNWCDKLMCYGVDDWFCASARRRKE